MAADLTYRQILGKAQNEKDFTAFYWLKRFSKSEAVNSLNRIFDINFLFIISLLRKKTFILS